MDNIDDFKTEMEFWAESSSLSLDYGMKLMYTQNIRKHLNLVVFILSLVSNLIILLFSDKSDKLNRLYKGKHYEVVYILTYIQISITILSYSLYIMTKARIEFRIQVNALNK